MATDGTFMVMESHHVIAKGHLQGGREGSAAKTLPALPKDLVQFPAPT